MNCQNKIIYKILPGDTLYTIAQKYKTTSGVILQLNGLSSPYNLQIGTDIIICPGIKDFKNTKLLSLSNEMRSLWQQHVWWTRMLILNVVDGLGGQKETTKRLLRNPGDIAKIYGQYYGSEVQNKVDELLTEHLVIAANLITAMNKHDTVKTANLDKKWHENAYEIATTLASINNFYDINFLREMLFTHLHLTKIEITHRINKDYADDVTNFDEVEKEALMMADYLTNGIYRQFINLFI